MEFVRSPRGVAVAIALTAMLAVIVFVDGDHPWLLGAATAVSVVIDVYVVACAIAAAHSGPATIRRFWTLMAAALSAWLVGDVTVGWNAAVADVLYLGSAVLIVVAMLHFPTEPRLRSRLRAVLEGVTAGLCLLLLAWVVVLNSVFDHYLAGDTPFSLTLLYPVFDIAALAIAIGVLIVAEPAQRTVLWLVTISIAIFTVADSAQAHAVAHGGHGVSGPLLVAWNAALVGFAAAAVVSRRTTVTTSPVVQLPPTAAVWLPYVPLLLAGTIGPFFVIRGFESVLVPFIVTAVCVRQAVAAWENRRLLKVTTEQALLDPLTGLANSVLFDDRLAHAMMLRSRHDRQVAVVALSLDDFTLVDDSLGQASADRLLVLVAQRIDAHIRAGDTAARLDRAEFALLLEGSIDDVHGVVKEVAEAISNPFALDEHEFLIRPSIGVAVATSAEPEITADRLMIRANAAKAAARQSGSSRVQTFDRYTELQDSSAPGVDGAARVRLLGELRHAVEHCRLAVAYQPKFDLRTGELVGVEALLRWPHPTMGTMRPDAFLSLIHEHGLMRPVTDLVVDSALDDVARWRSQGRHVPVAVNLFAPSLRDDRLPDALFEALSRRGLRGSVLTVEITEDMMLSDITLVTTVLQRLRDQGGGRRFRQRLLSPVVPS